jgi:hypothetical protein
MRLWLDLAFVPNIGDGLRLINREAFMKSVS